MFSLIIALTVEVLGFTGSAKARQYQAPVSSANITSPFGIRLDPILRVKRFHSGVDIGAKEGAPIRPVASGIVIFSGLYEGFGNLVVVRHGKDITTHYAHCWAIKVRVGELVSPSSVLGFVGRSGRATGPHLHFEVHYKGVPVNPEWLLSPRGAFNAET